MIALGERIEAVIFDLDGVMVDSELLQAASFNRVLSQYGVALTEDEFKHFVGRTQPEIFGMLRERFRIDEPVERLVARKREAYLRLVETELEAMPGLYELVNWLEQLGIKRGVASSSPLEDIEAVLRCIHLDEEGTFEAILSAVNLPHGKPHPDVFLLTAQAMSVEPERCIVIEDSAMGVEAAKRAAMVCIAMPNAFTRHQDFSRADFVVESLFEVREVLSPLVR